jgi:cytochrome c553
VNALTHRLLLAGALLAAAGAVHAQSAEDLRAGAYLAGNCANCHGTSGRSVGGHPPLAGIPRDGLLKAMRDFRDGRRSATLMHQLAKGYTDQQVELMGEYFSRQPAN